MEFIKILPALLGFITAIVALWSAAFLTGRFSPNIELTIEPRWSSCNKKAKLIIKIENQGFIRVGIDRVLFKLEIKKIGSLEPSPLIGGEWISFENAEPVMTSTYYINPKETVHVERLYKVDMNDILHVGLQVYLKYPWYIQKLGRQARSTRQTRTYYLSQLFKT